NATSSYSDVSILRRLLLLSFFFFQAYRDHRDLHSFPTRRSSDLVMMGAKPVSVFLGRGRRAARLRHALRDGEFAGNKHQKRDSLDRKSTRLNSSHVSISYAVFCLKKKNACNKRDRQKSRIYSART